MLVNTMSGLKRSSALALAAALWAVPALAENSNFGTLTLSSGFSASAGVATGYTSGSFSLSSISNRDQNNNLCLGYAGDRDVPDHVLVLQQDFARLSLQVKSKSNQTTLLIQGPGNTIRCADTSITDSWKAGTYKVWVGASEPGTKQDYTLSVKE